MIPIPAIDLKGGRVVRLLQGNFNEEKVYSGSAEAIAKNFEREGARRLHMVDLDGALEGEPKNKGCVERVIKTVKMPVQVGGGIRSLKTAEAYIRMGVSWVILGTKACLDKGFLREALAQFGPKVIVGIDASGGYVATDAWTKITNKPAVDLAKEAEALGAQSIIYTDISKDGALKGPNCAEINRMSQALKIDFIASGGIGSLEDINQLIRVDAKNVKGVIIGKALYENKFTLSEALKLCEASRIG